MDTKPSAKSSPPWFWFKKYCWSTYRSLEGKRKGHAGRISAKYLNGSTLSCKSTKYIRSKLSLPGFIILVFNQVPFSSLSLTFFIHLDPVAVTVISYPYIGFFLHNDSSNKYFNPSRNTAINLLISVVNTKPHKTVDIYWCREEYAGR